MLRGKTLLVLLLVSSYGSTVWSATEGAADPDGVTPLEAYQRLQRAAAARDVVALAAVLAPEHRALLLRDVLVAAMMFQSGSVEGVKPQQKHAEAIRRLVDEVVNPAVEAHPIDAALLEGHGEDSRMILILGWAISKMPVRDALRVARVAGDSLSAVDHPGPAQMLDAYIEQVPKGEVTITRQTDTAAWAEADGRPLGFSKHEGRWFAGGVWYDKKTIKLGEAESPAAGVSPTVIIAGKPAQVASGAAAAASPAGRHSRN